MQVGVTPTHSGFVFVPQVVQAEKAGVAQGLGVKVALHVPPEQTGCPAPPQATQAVFVALGTKPVAQVLTRHAPLLHVKDVPFAMSIAEHTRPQEPQFAASVEVFTQPAPVEVQSVRPDPHDVTHEPEEHTRLPEQRLLHMPQLLLSAARFTQVEPQRVWPEGHTHVPAEHTWPPVHARPQEPQFELSLPMRFTHEPEQLVCPVAHETTHVPDEQR